ncbi:hypothetical protein DSO57_1023331 [Entomophthora muscae]|uniref:Uncharacterized protein n=1 Tax=Entomophthora muscae TaxID=34485 RepID=A0ACC2UCK8_9FUNG|nr:hypothetical protein DSO57_1023331 [Entomophthora muscae]
MIFQNAGKKKIFVRGWDDAALTLHSISHQQRNPTSSSLNSLAAYVFPNPKQYPSLDHPRELHTPCDPKTPHLRARQRLVQTIPVDLLWNM